MENKIHQTYLCLHIPSKISDGKISYLLPTLQEPIPPIKVAELFPDILPV